MPAALRNASLIRDCQSLPVARKRPFDTSTSLRTQGSRVSVEAQCYLLVDAPHRLRPDCVADGRPLTFGRLRLDKLRVIGLVELI